MIFPEMCRGGILQCMFGSHFGREIEKRIPPLSGRRDTRVYFSYVVIYILPQSISAGDLS